MDTKAELGRNTPMNLPAEGEGQSLLGRARPMQANLEDHQSGGMHPRGHAACTARQQGAAGRPRRPAGGPPTREVTRHVALPHRQADQPVA